MPKPEQHVRWLFELSFSIYIAMLVVTEETLREPSILLRWGYPQAYTVLVYLHHHAGIAFRPSYLVDILWLWLAVIILFCLRLLRQVAALRLCGRYATGVVAVTGFPLISLNLTDMNGRSVSTVRWLWFEVAVIVACVFLYLLRRRPADTAIIIAILALHFGLWGWLTWWRGIVDWSLNLLLGIFTSSTWGLHVRLSGRFQPSAKAPVAQRSG